MTISSGLLFFFSGLGAFNGVLLALYFAIQKNDQLNNRLLAALLLMVSIRIGKSVFFYFQPDLSRMFLQMGLSACLLIGPLLYLYSRSSLQTISQQAIALHLLLPIAAILLAIGYPYAHYPEFWGDWVYRAINYFWLFYIVLTAVTLVRHWQAGLLSNLAAGKRQILLSVIGGITLVWLAYFTSRYTSYIAGALSFSFVLYLTFVIVISSRRQPALGKYQDKKIAVGEATQLLAQLTLLMQEEKLYCDANLTLPKLAAKLGQSVNRLSQLLNDNLQQSFADYINRLRIEDAKQLLQHETNVSIEAISERCGYNSMSTFYSAFKKFAETTPAQYRKNVSKL